MNRANGYRSSYNKIHTIVPKHAYMPSINPETFGIYNNIDLCNANI